MKRSVYEKKNSSRSPPDTLPVLKRTKHEAESTAAPDEENTDEFEDTKHLAFLQHNLLTTAALTVREMHRIALPYEGDLPAYLLELQNQLGKEAVEWQEIARKGVSWWGSRTFVPNSGGASTFSFIRLLHPSSAIHVGAKPVPPLPTRDVVNPPARGINDRKVPDKSISTKPAASRTLYSYLTPGISCGTAATDRAVSSSPGSTTPPLMDNEIVEEEGKEAEREGGETRHETWRIKEKGESEGDNRKEATEGKKGKEATEGKKGKEEKEGKKGKEATEGKKGKEEKEAKDEKKETGAKSVPKKEAARVKWEILVQGKKRPQVRYKTSRHECVPRLRSCDGSDEPDIGMFTAAHLPPSGRDAARCETTLYMNLSAPSCKIRLCTSVCTWVADDLVAIVSPQMLPFEILIGAFKETDPKDSSMAYVWITRQAIMRVPLSHLLIPTEFPPSSSSASRLFGARPDRPFLYGLLSFFPPVEENSVHHILKLFG